MQAHNPQEQDGGWFDIMHGNASKELSVDDYEMEYRCTESKDGGITGRLGR